MENVVLSARGLSKRFRCNAVLKGFDLELERGRVTVLLGRNGSGKSTFMKLCLGLLKPDSGAIRVCGHDPLRRARRVRQAVGYVPDKPDCYQWMTPEELYRFLAPQYPTWNPDEVARLVDTLSVPLETPFRGLSRGEGMKAMLVAALASTPELLLLDEPFAGLDAVVREEVLRGVIGALREGEQTVLCTTHDLDVAARIADDVAMLSAGRIIAHGPLADVLGSEDRMPDRMKELLVGAEA
ncbi:MAG: ABC transporter ATP-binding protein [Planctomycetota bacterium]|jgi:ABC-2 type transport system ATP-binding protein